MTEVRVKEFGGTEGVTAPAVGTGGREWRTGMPERRREGAAPRRVRVAAVGDVHCGQEDVGTYRELFAEANEHANVLALAGDLTRRGLPAEFHAVVGELADVKIPIVAVLGNHDHEAGKTDEAAVILRGRGIHLLDGDAYQFNEQVGFAGVKGFMGGFGRGTLTAFGESGTKAFVNEALEEAQKLELALRQLRTPLRVALLHYAPVCPTVVVEPEMIYCFLGTDRLAEPIDRYEATVTFHGHAHHGTFRGHTPGCLPVFNVSLPLLLKEGVGKMYYVHEVPLAPVSAP